MNSQIKPTKNSVWVAAVIANTMGHNPFPCPIEKIGWHSYRYSADQRENGALAGVFVNTIDGSFSYESDSTLQDLLKEDSITIDRNTFFNATLMVKII